MKNNTCKPGSGVKLCWKWAPKFWNLGAHFNFQGPTSFEYRFAKKTRHVFVKHGCPRRQQSQNMAKISKSYILTPPHPQGQVMSVKCEEPIDELTVQVWLLYDHPNFKYCTLFVSGTELRTDGQTDGRTDKRTDDPITRCPRRTFQAGGIKNKMKNADFAFLCSHFGLCTL